MPTGRSVNCGVHEPLACTVQVPLTVPPVPVPLYNVKTAPAWLPPSLPSLVTATEPQLRMLTLPGPTRSFIWAVDDWPELRLTA